MNALRYNSKYQNAGKLCINEVIIYMYINISNTYTYIKLYCHLAYCEILDHTRHSSFLHSNMAIKQEIYVFPIT